MDLLKGLFRKFLGLFAQDGIGVRVFVPRLNVGVPADLMARAGVVWEEGECPFEYNPYYGGWVVRPSGETDSLLDFETDSDIGIVNTKAYLSFVLAFNDVLGMDIDAKEVLRLVTELAKTDSDRDIQGRLIAAYNVANIAELAIQLRPELAEAPASVNAGATVKAQKPSKAKPEAPKPQNTDDSSQKVEGKKKPVKQKPTMDKPDAKAAVAKSKAARSIASSGKGFPDKEPSGRKRRPSVFEQVGFTPRQINALQAGGVKTIATLKKKSKAELNAIPGLGKKSVEDILSKLANSGR
ncbi:DNA-directed RNA polymerase subunit alpha C-terminal domain-containing protein [Vibrio barjaei]|uniref:DNA-directed RNA polymerase subunit alpha C-terminal domain-containing protein n=1 Tax=Vibrio barjaei TaxID=1676683 RepID=UPI0022851BC5|nr:DNA-directed RNA polymerase subunit alpha C-terminal domain-containing protein [Vibrio barjaei]MCY9870442.1 hypothetical protein [Vibrio barjaei]